MLIEDSQPTRRVPFARVLFEPSDDLLTVAIERRAEQSFHALAKRRLGIIEQSPTVVGVEVAGRDLTLLHRVQSQLDPVAALGDL